MKLAAVVLVIAALIALRYFLRSFSDAALPNVEPEPEDWGGWNGLPFSGYVSDVGGGEVTIVNGSGHC